jgi:hypothetical protein
MKDRPKAKTEGIISERVDDDLVVYDQGTLTAHSLSADTAAVWLCCDGSTSCRQIAGKLGCDIAAVDQAVAALRETGLLDDRPGDRDGISRREAASKLAKVGGAALAAPLIYSVVIPGAAAAISCHAQGTSVTCGTSTGQCNANSGAFGTIVGTSCPCYRANNADGCFATTSGTNGVSCWGAGSGPCSGTGAKPCCDPSAACTGGNTCQH